jgi:hypothetical protein
MNHLAPLLDAFRRAVHEGNIPACLDILRRLTSLDPDNPAWKQDLARFEQRRLQDMRGLADKAMAAGDLPALEALIRELDGPLSGAKDDALRADLTAALREAYGRRAVEQARAALANMATAFAARDMARADAYARQYQQLLTSVYFKPDPDMARQFDEAYRWLETQRRSQADTHRVEAMVATLRAELERRPPGRNLEATWNALNRAGAAVDPLLARRALDALAVIQETRRRRLRAAALAGLAMLLALGLAIITVHVRRGAEHERRQWLEALDQAAAQGDLAAFDAVLSQVQAARPATLKSEAFQQRVAARPALERTARTRAETLRRNLDRLEALLGQDPERPSLTQAAELLAAAERDRHTAAPEDAERLERLRPRVLALEARVRQPADQALRDLLDQFEPLLTRIETLASTSVDRADAILPQARTLASKADQLTDASPELREQAARAGARLAGLETALDARRKQTLAIARASSLPAYLAAIRTYSLAFPHDAVSRDLAALAAREPAYESLVALEGRAVTNADFYSEEFLLEAAGLPSDTLFWQPALEQLAARDRLLQERWPEARQAILALASVSNLTDLSVFEETRPGPAGTPITTRGYLQGRFQRETAGPDATVLAVSGEIYIPQPEDTQPTFRFRRFNADPADRIQIRHEPMPHVAFVKDLVSNARWVAPGNSDILLALTLDELAGFRQAGALFRARLADKLLGLFTNLAPDPLPPAWARAQRDLASLDPALSWLCDRHPEVAKANEHAEAILDKHFGAGRLGRQYVLDTLIQRAAISRGVRWVGYASFEDPPRPILTTPRRPGELWVMTGPAARVPELAVVAELHGEDIRTEWPLEPGALLFAPDDGRTTAECLRLIRSAARLPPSAVPTVWPAGWPINRR